ncbi:MAG TPA: ABC transporter substrate-binding protein [Candidatus Methylomirabilis sp.]|nr:ABC transporter substrate-binding protein [Candidatus Methylomirabilis sp.]
MRQLKGSWMALALSVLLALLGRPPAAPAQPNALVIGQPTDADSVDPHKITAVIAVERLYNLYDTLVNIDFNLETITPGLAESWRVSPDGKTYTFILKRGVKFHSGKPLTAQDVKFTLDRWRDPATASPTRNRIAEIDEVVAKDDQTVVIRLKERSNYLLFNLASGFASILNPEAVKKAGASYGTLAVDGTGPFKFKEWVLRDRFVVERNPEYRWGPPMFKNPGPAKVERVVWRVIPEDATRLFELEQGGGINVSRWIAFSELPRLRKDPRLRVIDYKVGYIIYLGFNLNKEIVQDIRVRRAVNHAIKKDDIVNEIFYGLGSPAQGPMSPIVAGAWKDVGKVAYDYNPARARALLDEAGWKPGPDGIRVKDGKRLVLPIHAIAGYGYPDTLTLIQSQLREVGIDVEQILLEEAAIWGRLAAGEHSVMAMGNPHSNPDEVLMFYFHSKNRPTPNRFGFADPKVDQFLEEGRTVADRKRWQEVYAEVQKRVVESAVWVPLWHPDRAMTMSARVSDLRPHPVYDVGYHKLLDVSVAP